jgi:hypothetical protein
MVYLLSKAALSGIIVAIASEVARLYAGWGAPIASLPLMSILGLIWLLGDTKDPVRIANHSAGARRNEQGEASFAPPLAFMVMSSAEYGD